MRRLISAHLDVGPGVAVPESSPGDLERRLLLPQRLVQVHDVRLHAGDLLDGEPGRWLWHVNRALQGSVSAVVLNGRSLLLRLRQQHIEAATTVHGHTVRDVLLVVQEIMGQLVGGVAAEQAVNTLPDGDEKSQASFEKAIASVRAE